MYLHINFLRCEIFKVQRSLSTKIALYNFNRIYVKYSVGLVLFLFIFWYFFRCNFPSRFYIETYLRRLTFKLIWHSSSGLNYHKKKTIHIIYLYSLKMIKTVT